MSSSIFSEKYFKNDNTFPSYSDDIESSTEESYVESEGYTFSDDGTTSFEVGATFSTVSLKRNLSKNTSPSSKMNDETYDVSTQSKSTVMTVLTTLDRALDAVVDAIIPPEKSITRIDSQDGNRSPSAMKKQPSIIQKIMSPRSLNTNYETNKDPTMQNQSPEVTAMERDDISTHRSYFDRFSPKGRVQDERDDVPSQPPGAGVQPNTRYGSELFRESSEKISSLFDIKWMCGSKAEEKEEPLQEDVDADTTHHDENIPDNAPVAQPRSKKPFFFRRRKRLVHEKENSRKPNRQRTLFWKKHKSDNQNESKPSRFFFRKKKGSVSNKSNVVVEEEGNVVAEKDCADWFMSGLCCESPTAEPSRERSNRDTQKRRWTWRRNRKPRQKYSVISSE